MFNLAPLIADQNDGAVSTAIGGAAIFFTLIIGFFIFIAAVIGILGTAFWIWMLVDAVRRDFEDPNLKVLWIIILILLGFIGAVVYYFVVKRKISIEAKPVMAPSEGKPLVPPKKGKRKIAKKS
jgi:TM2 domain-containing membrane protein YozV